MFKRYFFVKHDLDAPFIRYYMLHLFLKVVKRKECFVYKLK